MMKRRVARNLVLLYACQEELGFFHLKLLVRMYSYPSIEVGASFGTNIRLPSRGNTNGSVTPTGQTMKRYKKAGDALFRVIARLRIRASFFIFLVR